MTRLEAAQKIAEKLNAEGYAARVWTGGEHVRVYVTADNGKDCGYLQVNANRKKMFDAIVKYGGSISCLIDGPTPLFGKREQFEDAPVAAEETFEGVPYWKIRKAAKEGTLATLLTPQQIADAVRTGVVTESNALNQDA